MIKKSTILIFYLLFISFKFFKKKCLLLIETKKEKELTNECY